MLFDTHCHLTHAPLMQQLPRILAEAAAAEVTHFLVPGTTPNDWDSILKLAQQYDAIYAALGLHPWFVCEHHLAQALTTLNQRLIAHPQLWVGEIGLDFMRATSSEAQQQQIDAFEAQLQLAQAHQRCVVIHNVHASSACLSSIKRCHFTQGGFAHAFSGSLEEAQEWVKCGFKIGMGSLLLKPNARKIRRIATELPLSSMVLETDAPYMSPEPNHPNHPRNTQSVAKVLAELKQTNWHTIAQATSTNAFNLLQRT
ncbi:TatD family hydrolase [Snodgrassella sp. CFCC 13594]|uniref:TatD family hydrolase n=1 Tax=Snodgrassella sp. CFCC 13594 TaxID=1775559 RepID=UPI00082D345A|nr:TatD family hydrolase [Snodgrassella sp. CFCC 13594]